MGLVYRSMVIHPWLSFMMVTSKNYASELLISVNFILRGIMHAV